MSDAPASRIVAEGSQFTPEASQFTPSLDLSRIDRNIQQISAVEQTWGLPALPDEVKVDLATLRDVDDNGLFAFLTGLDDRLRESADDDDVPELEPIPNRGLDQLHIIVASLSGNPAPEVPTEDAVQRFKLDAIRHGLLDEDPRKVDSSWSPEYNRIRNDLAFEKYDERSRGAREGASTLSGVNKLLYDFTSPAGLLAAATQLDLWWGTDSIGEEISSWGDKWRKLGEAENPFDWGFKLFDALTGPIDDILLPVINVGLLFTGVGAAANTGRIAALMSRGRSLDAIGDLFRSSRMARWSGGNAALRNFEELGRASLTGGMLSRRSNALARKTGEVMQAWRRSVPVRTAKGALIQPGMRAGFASQLESRLGTYQGGTSIADVSDPVNELSQRLYLAGQSPVLTLPEVMIAPYNIFTPGTFVNRSAEGIGVLSRLGRGARAGVGTVGGRAAIGAAVGAGVATGTGDDMGDTARGALIGAGVGAIAPRVGGLLMKDAVPGALKSAAVGAGAGALLGDDPEDIAFGASAGVGLFAMSPTVRRIMTERLPSINKAVRGTGRALDLTSFKPLSERHDAAMAVHLGMVSHLENLASTAETTDAAQAIRRRLNRWQANVRTSGVTRALAEEMELGSSDVAEHVGSGAVTWVNTLLAIDHIATTQAQALKGPWRGRWHAARNKLANQLRPFDLDQPSEALFDDFSMAIALTEGTAKNRQDLLSRADTIRKRLVEDPEWALEQVNAHRKNAADTMYQLWRPDNMPKLDDAVDAGFSAADQAPQLPPGLAGVGAEGRAALMQRYMPQIWERFGNWPKFTAATESIRQARASGILDPAVLVTAKTRTGRASRITDVTRRVRDRPLEEANEALTDAAMSRRDPQRLHDAAVTPAAPSVLPGRVTVELLDTKTGQELFELREEVVDLLDARDHLKRLEGVGWRKVVGSDKPIIEDPMLGRGNVNPFRGTEDVALSELTRGTIARLAKELPTKESKDSFRYIVGFAKRKGLTLDQLSAAIDDTARQLADDAKRWDDFGLPSTVADDKGRTLFGYDALKARADDLQERWQYAAKEVDLGDLEAQYRSAGRRAEADEVAALREGLERDGYKLVHGTEFVMPEDLAFVPKGAWDDVTRRHLNYATIGNFFKGRLPVEGHIVADLRHRAALVRELSDLKDSPLSKARTDSEEVDGIIDFLNTWLRDDQDRVEALTRHMDLGSRSRRTLHRLTSSMTPVNIEDLQMRGPELRAVLEADGFSSDEARAIARATARFRNSSFRDMGLYSLEARLRSQNQAASALKLLGGSTFGESFLQRGRGGRFVGAFVGGAYGRAAGEEGDSFEERLGKVALGAAGGIAAGTVAPNVLRGAGNVARRGAEMASGLEAGALVGTSRDWRYGYMADAYARARDALRFTLSPIFDASRYTEGMLLAHTGAPLRHPKTGERLILPANMTPRALRRQLNKKHGSVEGRKIYDGHISRFQKYARDLQDFDPEALDATGRWFKQVGILGFSPVDWMGTAFVRLMDEGLDPAEAYDAVRRMYTYASGRGVGRTRSAAEMSVNFVMFPFSFQKKALGHIAKWMHDDLGRSIIIHDALKTYEMLDEEHNLDERWKDYFPWIDQLQRLNLFAYGLSAGRLGGINSQLFETGGKYAWNMFVPAGMNIQVDNAEEIQALQRNLLPVYNDINWMIQNVKEQGNVLTSDTHMTLRAERAEGWNKWNEFKQEFDAELATRGYTLEDIFNKPWLEQARAHYEDKRTELADKYPEWWKSRVETIGNIQAEQQARALMIDRYERDTRAGMTPTVDDTMIAQFETLLEDVKKRMRLTMGIDSLEDAPPAVLDEIKRVALDYLRQNPRWLSLWGTYYERQFGPLTTERSL